MSVENVDNVESVETLRQQFMAKAEVYKTLVDRADRLRTKKRSPGRLLRRIDAARDEMHIARLRVVLHAMQYKMTDPLGVGHDG